MLRIVPRQLRPAAALWLLVIAFGLLAKTELQQSIVAIVAVFVGVPLLLVGLTDAVRSGNERDREDAAPRLARRIALLPARVIVGFLGASGILFGLGIGAWVFYNLLVERQPEFREGLLPIPSVGIAPLLVIGGLALLRSALGREDSGPSEAAALEDA